MFPCLKKIPGNFYYKILGMMKDVWDCFIIKLKLFVERIGYWLKEPIQRIGYIIENIMDIKNMVVLAILVYATFTLYLVLDLFIDRFDSVVIFYYTMVILLPIILIAEIILFSIKYTRIKEVEREQEYRRRFDDLHRQRLQVLKDLAELKRRGVYSHPDDIIVNNIEDLYL